MSKEKKLTNKYVVVHLRARDNYCVATALKSAGKLESLVTDYYYDSSLWLHSRFTPPRLRKRSVPTILGSDAISCPTSLIAQSVGMKAESLWPFAFRYSNDLLARTARRVATERKAGIFAYSNHAQKAFAGFHGPKVVFQFHPYKPYCKAILDNDAKKFPGIVDWSQREEHDSQDLTRWDKASLDGWKFADLIIAASTFTAKSLIASGADPTRVVVAPYPFPENLRHFRREKPLGQIRFLFVGQGVQRKGLHHLALAWRSVCKELHSKAELTVVAHRIDPGIRDLLRLPGIRVLGAQSREALDDLFAESHVFVMPSLIEGFGHVYTEALAAGCYVIGTKNTGLPDITPPEDAVGFIEPGNIEHLASLILSAVYHLPMPDNYQWESWYRKIKSYSFENKIISELEKIERER